MEHIPREVWRMRGQYLTNRHFLFTAGHRRSRIRHTIGTIADWMDNRVGRFTDASPVSIYEMHLGSWARMPEKNNRELAAKLADYVGHMRYTHVELLDVMSDAFTPNLRHGHPQDPMYFVDKFHQRNWGDPGLDFVERGWPGSRAEQPLLWLEVSGQGNLGGAKAAPFEWNGHPHSLFIILPPLAAVAFKRRQQK